MSTVYLRRAIAILRAGTCLFAVVIATLLAGCSRPMATSTGAYNLKHGLADLEYALSWDAVRAKCPGIDNPGQYHVSEGFMGRGNAGGVATLSSNSPAMWLSGRIVALEPVGTEKRELSIWLWFFETTKELDEHMQQSAEMQGIPVQTDGLFRMGIVEDGPHALRMVVAGNRLCVLITDTASSEELLAFGRDELTELMPAIRNRLAETGISPLPWPRIPRRTS